jgi:hypothetical protein
MSKLILRLLAALSMLAIFLLPARVASARPNPGDLPLGTSPADRDVSCIACHEALYLNHDTGKWYCLCEVRARCTYCHGGVVGELTEDAAHQNMVANPVQQGTETCQGCHPQDVDRRLSIFAARAGFSATPCPTVAALAASLAPPPAAVPPATLEAWQIGALLLLGLGFAGLTVFAYLCWRSDCLRRSLRS